MKFTIFNGVDTKVVHSNMDCFRGLIGKASFRVHTMNRDDLFDMIHIAKNHGVCPRGAIYGKINLKYDRYTGYYFVTDGKEFYL